MADVIWRSLCHAAFLLGGSPSRTGSFFFCVFVSARAFVPDVEGLSRDTRLLTMVRRLIVAHITHPDDCPYLNSVVKLSMTLLSSNQSSIPTPLTRIKGRGLVSRCSQPDDNDDNAARADVRRRKLTRFE